MFTRDPGAIRPKPHAGLSSFRQLSLGSIVSQEFGSESRCRKFRHACPLRAEHSPLHSTKPRPSTLLKPARAIQHGTPRTNPSLHAIRLRRSLPGAAAFPEQTGLRAVKNAAATQPLCPLDMRCPEKWRNRMMLFRVMELTHERQNYPGELKRWSKNVRVSRGKLLTDSHERSC